MKGPVLPKEGDRVLVEADYNPSMPFKWNATRVQIVNMGGGGGSSSGSQQSQQQSYGGGYSSSKQVPPPPALSSSGGGSGGRSSQQQPSSVSSLYGCSTSAGRSHVSSSSMNDPLMSRGGSRSQQQLHIHPSDMMSSGLIGGLPPLMSKIDSSGRERERDRDRERKDKERERGGRDRYTFISTIL